MKVNKISSTTQENTYKSAVDKDLTALFLAMQKRITFGDNIASQIVSVADTGSANTEFTVAHNLGVIPIGYIVISTNKASVFYKSTTAWTSSNVYLKANAANCAITLILIKE